MGKLKEEEKSARKFLMRQFGTEPEYEPLGPSTPPDFCIGHVAFEVRRLNEHFVNERGVAEGLEQVDVPLSKAVWKELQAIPYSQERGTYFYTLRFARPLKQKPREIARVLAKLAASHYADGTGGSLTICAF